MADNMPLLPAIVPNQTTVVIIIILHINCYVIIYSACSAIGASEKVIIQNDYAAVLESRIKIRYS